MTIFCPHCKKVISGDIICDNDCGTVSCDQCLHEFYTKLINGIYYTVKGHSPLCGESDTE